ncbi:hypothetical protein XO12_04785 [Marinitoga sp. 1154]|uniref:tetratricopeptide repeat protein n=1 Tax=Marinitoga sp. 1154 TaxID=1643335 RepID=UPI001586048A|nr:tetratricopeptide repeat protein [Marinitoga sp. 1154]NUU99440.1 hypothetical protein [Marinitoga sp. 1154]
MKKTFVSFFLVLSIILFSISIEDIKNLSKMPDTLNQAWGEFIKYIAENPDDPAIGVLGEVLSAKKYFYKNYKNAPFFEALIQENFNKFCGSLGLYNNILNEDETGLILKIFPQIPLIVKRTLETGIMELNSYKNLYKLEGLEKYITPFSYEGFLQILVDKSIKSPVFLDKDMENFIVKFVPKSKIRDINNILNNSTYFLDENNYMGAFKLLSFLKEQGVISANELQTYSLLKKYFDLKTKIGELSSNIYIISPEELLDFTLNVLDIVDQTVNLNIEKNTLYTLLEGVIKTIRIRIESSNKIIFKSIPDKLDDLIEKSPSNISKELTNLKKIILNSTLQNTKEQKTSDISTSSKATSAEKGESKGFIIYPAIVIILIILLVLYIPYNVVSYKSVEFYMNLKMYKVALKVVEKILIKNPDDYKAYILMARILEELNEIDKAMIAYKTAHNKRKNHDLK